MSLVPTLRIEQVFVKSRSSRAKQVLIHIRTGSYNRFAVLLHPLGMVVRARRGSMDRVAIRSFDDFPPARLYADDLREVIGMFEDVCRKTEVKAGDYRISTAAELDDLIAAHGQDTLPDLKIQGFDPYVSVDFMPYGIRAYSSDDTAVQLGLIAKLRAVVERGRTWRPPQALLWVPAGVLAGVSGYLFSARQPIPALTALSLALLIFLADVLLITRRSEIKLYTYQRNSRPGFIQRNGDQLVLLIVGAIAGAIITYLVGLLMP